MTTEKKKHTLHQQVNNENYTFDKSSDFGCCLIIKINKTTKTIGGGHSIQKFRTGAEAEVQELQDVFRKPIYETKVIEEKNEINYVIPDVEKYIIKNDGNFQACKIFACVVLAFGGQGFFYDSTGNKISMSTVVRKFQSRPALRLKPKLFVVQLCDINLQPVGKHVFAEVEGGSYQPSPLWPREADVLIYESNITDLSCSRFNDATAEGRHNPKQKEKRDLKEEAKNNTKAGELNDPKGEEMNDPENKGKNSTTKEEKMDPKEGIQNYFEFNEVILRTNSKLSTFIKDRNN
ncbi:uncharacterized protein LOC134278878 [Saccostrea cucullata]|uniref:uncharacterized protein LOC134278878 n=1 Tax=Saccostrea cuccullata TaxID=36930 RepID=UPI002ED42417